MEDDIMSWKDILKGEEAHPSAEGYFKRREEKLKRLKEEVTSLENKYNSVPLNVKEEREMMAKINSLLSEITELKENAGIERQRPKDDKTLFQLDVMNYFRDFVLKVMSLNFSGRSDRKNEKGEVEMPLTISVIQLLKKFGKGYFIGPKGMSLSDKRNITPAEFVEKERKLAEAIIDQIVDTLKVFPKLEVTREDIDRGQDYTDKFIRYAKSKLPRLSVSMATD